MTTLVDDTVKWDGGIGSVVRPSTAAGGTLRLASCADVDSLDPARTYYGWVWLLHRMMSRTLMAYPTDPGPAGLTPVPDLAGGPPERSPDGLRYTYRLRRGIHFDDGTEVRADHVRYAIQRTFARTVLPGGPTTLHPLLDDPARPYAGPYADPDGLSSVVAPDPWTLVLRLNRPFADIDHVLAQPCTAPVPPAADTRERYEESPLSSGPYRVSERIPGRWIALERNPRWDRGTDPIRPALPDRVEITLGLGHDELDDRLLAGEFDLCVEGRGIQHAAQRRIVADETLRAQADNPETGFLQFVSIHPQVAPLGNVHARRAIHVAADRVSLQEARGGPVTGGEIATQLIPRRLPSHRDWCRYPTGPDATGDLAAARRELTAAGLPDGFSARIGTQSGKFRLVAESLRDAVARVGIELEIVDLDVATYFSRGVGSPETIARARLGLAVNDWGADFPTEYGFLAPLVDGRLINRHGGNFNVAELDDPAVNTLVDRALATVDPRHRDELWAEVERIVMDHAVILPTVHDKTLHFRWRRATNVFVHPAFGLYDVQAVGVTEEESHA